MPITIHRADQPRSQRSLLPALRAVRREPWERGCGPMAKNGEEIKCKHLFYWSGEQGIELFNSWDLSADELKKLDNYWERFEHFVKPHSNELIAAWELHTLSQGTLSLEEFIAKLRILVKEANYPVEHNDRFLRDFLVLVMNSDVYVRTPSRLEMPSRLT